MGEENNTGAQGAENQSEEEAQDDNGASEGDNGGEEENGEGEGDDKGKPAAGAEDDEEPAVRKKTAKDYIIERKQKQIEKLKQKKEDNDQGGESEEDDDVSPEDEKVVRKIIQREYGEKFAKLDQVEDEGELKSFLAENPNFEPYKAKIWKFWQHPSRNHLPISSVAYEVAGPHLMKLGAKKAQQADDKAKQSSSGGGSSRNAGGKIDYSAMTDAEFQAHVNSVKQKQRN